MTATARALRTRRRAPIVADSKIIGSVGVSGVTSEQDAQIDQAGIDALK